MTTTPYSREYSFKAQQAASPTSPLSGANLDIELDNVSGAINTTQSELRKIQKSDGTLETGVVGQNQLTNELLAMVSAPNGTAYGAWVSNKAYLLRDLVSLNDATYLCVVAHTSSSNFLADKAAGKWVLFATSLKGDPRIYEISATGNGSSTTFPLPVAPISGADVFVWVNGVIQPSTNYTISGTSLIFNTAPANGHAITGRVAATLVDSDATDVTGKTVTYEGQKPRIESFFEDAIYTGPAGVIANGTTDQWAKMQDLINKAVANNRKLILTPGSGLIRCSQALTVPSAVWEPFEMHGTTRDCGLVFSHNGPYLTLGSSFNISRFCIRGDTGYGTNSVGIAVNASRANMFDISIAGANRGLDMASALAFSSDHLEVTNCTTGIKLNGIAPGARFRNLYVHFCATGLDFASSGTGNVYNTLIDGFIEWCTLALRINGGVKIKVNAWIEACTDWLRAGGAVDITDYDVWFAGTSSTVRDLAGAALRFDQFQDIGTGRLQTRLENFIPVAYGDSTVNNADRYLSYIGLGGNAADDGAFKGILTYAEKPAGNGSGAHVVIKAKRARGFSTNYISPALGNNADFLEVDNRTIKLPLPVYANNADALAGLLVADQLYRTATGEIRVVV